MFYSHVTNGLTGASLGVVPVLIGPLQVLLAILPGLLVAVAAAVVSMLRPRAMWNLLKVLWRLKVQVAIAAAAGLLVYWAAARLWPAGGGAALAAARGAGEHWPIFRGGLSRLGAAAGAAGPGEGGLNWARQAGEEWFYASPAVVGNRVYVASASISPFDRENGDGRIYCFDADTGAVAWAVQPKFKTGYETYRATFSSPTIRGDSLVCGEGLHWTAKARVICLDVAAGTLRWSFQTASHVECTPVIADVVVAGRREARVFVGAGDDGYYALDLASGAVRWHLPGEKYPDAETSLAVHAGKVYAGLGNGGKALCVIDAADGRELARAAMPYAVFSPPAIAGGKLYVGMGNGDFVESAHPAIGEVWCVDLARLAAHKGGPMEPDWKVRTAGTVLGAVAVAGERVYFGDAAGRVHAVDRRSGRPIAHFDAGSAVHASPAVAGTCVYVITEAGMVYGLDRRTLACVWECRASSEPRCISSPAVAGGRLYVGTQEDGFVCLGRPGQAGPAVWRGHIGGAGCGGNASGSPPPSLGKLRWRWPGDQDGEGEAAVVAAPPAVAGKDLLVSLDKAAASGLVCLPTAAAARKAPTPRWTYRTPHGVRLSPAVVGDRAFCADGHAGQAGRNLHCVGLRDGQLQWKAPLARAAAGAFIATADDVLVLDGPAALASYELSGKPRWSAALAGRAERAPAASASIVVVATVEPASLAALDRPTGRRLWQVPLPVAPLGSPWIERDRVYVATGAALEARSLLDGAELPPHMWARAGGGVSGDFVLSETRAAFINVQGDLVVLSRTDGRLACPPVAGALAGSTPLLGGDAVLYHAADGKIMKLALPAAPAAPAAAPEPTEWMDATWLGRPVTPIVLAGSDLYVGRTGWGLVCLGGHKR